MLMDLTSLCRVSELAQDVSQRWIKMAKRNISLFTTTQEAMANVTLV
jgi:hypothetical protein